MKTFLAIPILLLISIHTFAQNKSLLPLFDQAKNYFNPALTGDKDKTTFYAIGGYQYVGYFVNGFTTGVGPSKLNAYRNKSSINADFSSPVYSKGHHRISLGGYYSYQQKNEDNLPILYKNNARVNLAYSYKSKMGAFSLGTYGEFVNMKSDLGVYQAGYTETRNFYTAGAGVAYRSKNERFYVGVSANNLFPQTLQTKNIGSPPHYYHIPEIYFVSRIYYNLISGIEIPLNKNLTLDPSINIVRNYIIAISSNLMTQYKKKYLFGIQYNSNDSWSDQAGIRLGYKTGSTAIHYAYMVPLDRRIITESGQHTLGLVYTFGK